MTIDQQLLCYKRLPNWTATTLPEMVTQKHNTKVGTWAKLTILSGSLHFYELDEQGEVTAEHLFTPETEIPFVEPQAWHRIAAASDDLECYLSFYCKPEDYMAKKYDTKLTPRFLKQSNLAISNLVVPLTQAVVTVVTLFIWHLLGMMLQPLMLITKLHNASK